MKGIFRQVDPVALRWKVALDLEAVVSIRLSGTDPEFDGGTVPVGSEDERRFEPLCEGNGAQLRVAVVLPLKEQ